MQNVEIQLIIIRFSHGTMYEYFCTKFGEVLPPPAPYLRELYTRWAGEEKRGWGLGRAAWGLGFGE